MIHMLAGPFMVLVWPLFGDRPQSRLLAAVAPALSGVRCGLTLRTHVRARCMSCFHAPRLALGWDGVTPEPGACCQWQNPAARNTRGPGSAACGTV